MQLAKLSGRRKPDVQMSPLIDVVFLLLIFYAVTTQFVTDERLKLKLPEAKTAESQGVGREDAPPEVKVAADGTVWINDVIVPEGELEAQMKALVERGVASIVASDINEARLADLRQQFEGAPVEFRLCFRELYDVCATSEG